MTVVDMPSGDGSSASEVSGGDSSSSDGSSSTTTAAAASTLAEKVRAGREAKGLSRYKLDTAIKAQGMTKRIEEQGHVPGPHTLQRLGEVLEIETASPQPPDASPTSAAAERRPSAEGSRKRRGIFGGRPKVERPDAPRSPQARPAVRRVSTSPLTESVLTFAAGGMARIGQHPLGSFTAFTAPVAAEIVDEAIAGTVADKLVQPLVRGSEKYQNLGALFAGYASIAWASNVPEAEPQAFALFQWSMTVLLPLQGKQMVKRAKEQEKAMQALEEIMPELAKLVPPQFQTDPIRGLWAMMWAQPPEAQPQPAEEPANA